MADYQRRLLDAGHLAFEFPVWWDSMPAATKGFLDRVLTEGVLYSADFGPPPRRNRLAGAGHRVDQLVYAELGMDLPASTEVGLASAG